MRKKRHTAKEIIAKLDQADALLVKKQTLSKIAATLGVTTMALYRWRKAKPQGVRRAQDLPFTSYRELLHPPSRASGRALILELQNENAYLRKIVVDLLLEKRHDRP